MQKRVLLPLLLLLLACGAWLFSYKLTQARTTSENWDPARAAAYLDSREVYWQSWAPAQLDKGTVCISCHTVLPYAMARPTLRTAIHETSTSLPEKVLTDSIEKRVADWAQMPPYYSDRVGPDKAAQSRATEAVLNAVILASEDTRQGRLRPITREAFEEAWALQQATGGWKWQDFHLAPWESAESAYQGAALLALEIGKTPDNYGTQSNPHLDRLWDYLHRGYSSQPVLNQLYVLWASAKSPRPLSQEQNEALVARLESLQHRDGGWSLPSLVVAPNLSRWQRLRTQLKLAVRAPQSDGCATGLVVLALEESGMSQQNPTLQRGLRWLVQHQNADGSWSAESLNKKRNPHTNVGLFMSDAATGYAVMALEESSPLSARTTPKMGGPFKPSVGLSGVLDAAVHVGR